MNTTPSSVRLTPAAHLLVFTLIALATTVISYMAGQPFVYIVALPCTLVGILLTGDCASRYSRRS